MRPEHQREEMRGPEEDPRGRGREMAELNPGQDEIERVRHAFENSGMPPIEDSRTRPPFVARVEEKCEDCGGAGYDWGSLRPMDPAICPTCQGSGTQTVVRNYLAEALRIAAGKSSRLAQREHLEAVIQHFRDLVGALIAI